MPRTARIVAEGLPHHIIQRGNRRQKVFLSDNDKMTYLELLCEQKLKYQMEIWSYCLMDNHIHLIVVPESQDSLAKASSGTYEIGLKKFKSCPSTMSSKRAENIG